MMQVILTLLITLLYGKVWEWLEIVIEGEVKNTMVDNVIMVLFIPIIYLAAGVILERIL